MKKWKRLFVGTGVLLALSAVPVYAAGWQWMDNNGDNVSECYYVQDDGSILKGTTTPDGYTVNEQGAWVENGVVKTQVKLAEETKSVSNTPSKIRQESIKTSQLDKFQYVLYTPKNATENMPLIIYLHGSGTPNMDSLKDEIKMLRKEADRKSNAYILAPLLPPELDLGKKGMWKGIEPSIMELIESVADTCQIDRKRISIMGGSMGADSAIEIVSLHPDVFSCMVGVVPFHYKSPMAKWEDGWGEKLKTVPTWFFVEDEGEAVTNATAAVNDIIAAGGQAWVEVQTGADHGEAGDLVEANEKSLGIYDWMVSISK